MSALGTIDTCRTAQNLAHNCNYAVFPCRNNKHPACPHGFCDASRDPDAIAGLWRRHPGPLIGIATGAVSGIDVLDIDAKHDTALAWWQCAASRIPPTTTYRTRSGGLHLYFQHAPGVADTASKIARGVDTRGDGGYVISWFAAGYGCEDHSPAAPWSAWLLACVLWRPSPATLPPQSSARHADAAVRGVVRTVSAATEGGRNSTLYWAAHRLCERVRAGQLSVREADSLLTRAAAEAGLPAIEARRTIASAWSAA